MKRILAHISLYILMPLVTFGAVMQSTSYQILNDSVNNAGQENAASSRYKIFDTVGESGTGLSSSANYNLSAGYRSLKGAFISITAPPDMYLTPNINGVTGGVGNAQAEWTVTTDSTAGYSLGIKADTDPAMKSATDSFADYDPGAEPTFDFTVGASESAFGFSPEGVDITGEYYDDGFGTCNVIMFETADACWDGLSTTDKIIAQNFYPNYPEGAATLVKVRAVSGSSHAQTIGSYTATVIVTAVTM